MIHVLVVDDLPDVRLSFMYMLQSLGYAPVEAHDGFSALAIIAQQRIDVVLADLYMPEIDGFALTRAIRKLSVPHRPPVIWVTGGEISRAEPVDASAVLRKPVTREALSAAIQVALNGRHSPVEGSKAQKAE